VLDFGSAESTVSLSLASMGFEVTALDMRRYPFAHPNLQSVAAAIEGWDAEPASYDAAFCISTVEHVGLGWYGDPDGADDGDHRALERIGGWLRPGGLLVLTVPYGAPGVDAVQRRYDRAALDALLHGWDVVERRIVEQVDDVTWQPVEESDGHAVALVVARKSAGT
jgi:2-polyprenyl-3-methyl-5-hydroxy-6-metoxy-1,4-benzoquinol methylase